MKDKEFNLTIENDPLLVFNNPNIMLVHYKNFKFFNPISLFCSRNDFAIRKQIKNNFSSRIPFLGGHDLKNYISHNLSIHGLELIFNSYFIYMNYPLKDKHKHFYHFKKRMAVWLKESFFPITLLRVILYLNSKNSFNNEFIKIIISVKYITDYQHRVKFYYPKTIEQALDPKIIYFGGCVFGDGNIHYEASINIADGHPDQDKLIYSKYFLEKLKHNLYKIFNLKSSVGKVKDKNLFLLQITNKWFVRFFKYLFEIDSGKKIKIRLPSILSKRLDLQKFFWRGIFDTDGRASEINQAVTVSSKSKLFLSYFTNYLNKFNINHKLSKERNKLGIWYVIYINSSELKKFCENIGSSHPRKQKLLYNSLKNGAKETIFKGINKNSLLNGNFNFNLLKLNSYKQRNKIVNLPKKANFTLLKLARFIRPKNSNVLFIRRRDDKFILTNKQMTNLTKKFEKTFMIKRRFENSRRIPHFYNSLLSRFFSNYFIYEKPWQVEFPEYFIEDWNKIWIN